MKNLRILMTAAAFTFAFAGAIAYDDDFPNFGLYGEHPLGYCVEVDEDELSPECGDAGFYQCRVFLEEVGGRVPAYKIQDDPYSCAGAIWRWF